MTRILKIVLPFTIILGTILIATFTVNINGFTIVQLHNKQIANFTWIYYTIDLSQYLKNINNALVEKNINGLLVELPTAPNFPNDILEAIKWVGNIFIYCWNMVIYVFDWLLLVPTKLILYPTNIIFSLFGLNTGNNIWVNTVIQVYDWQIPYIPYIS